MTYERLMRNIRKDIRFRLQRQKKGYSIYEIMTGLEVEDWEQLIILKSVFPEIYLSIEKEIRK